jgi:hypothetical protein
MVPAKQLGSATTVALPGVFEVETKWRATNGGLVVEKNKPAHYGFQLHDQIISISAEFIGTFALVFAGTGAIIY